MRVVMIPLAWYWGITIVVPFLNGSSTDPLFVEHAATSLIAGAVAAGVFSLLRRPRP